jgi:hypothetical protein
MEDWTIIEAKKEIFSPFVEATGFPKEPMSEDQRDFYRAWAIACTGLGLVAAYILMCGSESVHHGILGFIFPC